MGRKTFRATIDKIVNGITTRIAWLYAGTKTQQGIDNVIEKNFDQIPEDVKVIHIEKRNEDDTWEHLKTIPVNASKRKETEVKEEKKEKKKETEVKTKPQKETKQKVEIKEETVKKEKPKKKTQKEKDLEFKKQTTEQIERLDIPEPLFKLGEKVNMKDLYTSKGQILERFTPCYVKSIEISCTPPLPKIYFKYILVDKPIKAGTFTQTWTCFEDYVSKCDD